MNLTSGCGVDRRPCPALAQDRGTARRSGAQFLDAIALHRLYAAYHLIALRGLRRGEAAGLRWCDVDLDEGTAVICRQLQPRDGRLMVCPPKTVHSNRVIALDRTTIAALRVHRSRQHAEADADGECYRVSGYVFTNRNGDPISPGWLTHIFQRLIAAHGVPPIRLHDLRHGAATLALAAGMELKVVQEMLGHSSIVLTADTYTSVLPEVAHTAAEKTAAYLHRAAGVVPGTTPAPRPCSGPASTAGGEPYPGGPGAAPVDRFAPRTGVAPHPGSACCSGSRR
ncbi:site-specific integrase [Actinomadura madurae]|uniref:site-specific integrase n=1 Tax=Actinomadura madurae TaxID=1993 RepID=UPI000D8EE2BF|nr:site-specific integrase [Actinomadura madurae]SPT51288.1 Integrase [Actinomadura madurae]